MRSDKPSTSASSVGVRHPSEEGYRHREGPGPLGVKVSLRTVHPLSPRTGDRTHGGFSIDSFEAFFEDEDDAEGEADSLVPVEAGRRPRSPPRPSKIADPSTSFSTSMGSNRSSRCLSHSQGDSEGDDNMSAITWPEPAPKKTGRLEVQSGSVADLKDVVDRAEMNSQRNYSSSSKGGEEEEEEDCSLEGDGFLHELDALSYFWAQRRKGIESKAMT